MASPHKERFLEAYDAHADEIYRHCYFRVFSEERAEELVQETFLRAWRYLADGRTVENLRAFLYRTATNLIIDDSRRKKETSLDALLEVSPSAEPSADGEADIEKILSGKEVIAALQKLDDSAREVLTLRYVDDLDIAEIATMLEITPNNVSVRINRAIKALQKVFRDYERT